MITIYPYAMLGQADHGWLHARHHFSFAHYYNPDRMGFGALRAVNDDSIQAGTGFPSHPHRDMEIITYVRTGAISHRDSEGNNGRTEAGAIQVMSAGSGVSHSEYNREQETTRLYQIWIAPERTGVKPRWEARKFPVEPVQGALMPLASGRSADLAQAALFIHQDATLFGGRLKAGTRIEQPIVYQAYVLASDGEFEINGRVMAPGDGAEVTGVPVLTIKALTDSEVLVLDVPPQPTHQANR